MKSLEGLVTYPWAIPAHRMINGVAVSDSESDDEEGKTKKQVLPPAEEKKKKIALVIDTNVLLKQMELRHTLKIKDQETFDELFEVITLSSVIDEIKDEQSRRYVNTGLPYSLITKDTDYFIEKQDMIQV